MNEGPEKPGDGELVDDPTTMTDVEDSSSRATGEQKVEPPSEGRAFRALLVYIIVIFAAGNICYRLLHRAELEQTAALFIGLPAVLAIALIYTPRAKTVTGSILKGLTIALLMSGPILGEGFLCILVASPLFYAVGAIIGLVEDRSRRRMGRPDNRLRVVVWLPIFLMSLEGVSDSLSFPRRETVSVTREVTGTVEECEQQLGKVPEFAKPLPAFLAAGWPRPAETEGSGLEPGSLRKVRFVGSEGKPGWLTMKVKERGPGSVRFVMVEDTSHMPHWLSWDDATVQFEPAGADRTRVTWTTRYIRRLDPAWYFAPWQRYAVRLATGYLLDNLATPRQ